MLGEFSSIDAVKYGLKAAVYIGALYKIYAVERPGESKNEWLVVTHKAVTQLTGLSQREQQTARRKIKESGVVDTKFDGMPAKLQVRFL